MHNLINYTLNSSLLSVHCKLAQQCTVCTECTEVSGSCLACDQAPRERGCAALLTHCQQWSTEAVLNSTALTSSTDCLVSGIVLNTHYWVTTASSLRQGDSEKEGAIKTLVSHQLWGREEGQTVLNQCSVNSVSISLHSVMRTCIFCIKNLHFSKICLNSCAHYLVIK